MAGREYRFGEVYRDDSDGEVVMYVVTGTSYISECLLLAAAPALRREWETDRDRLIFRDWLDERYERIDER